MPFLSKKQLLKLNFQKIGNDVQISDKASLYNTELMEIGDRTRIDDYCVLSGKVVLGRNIHIAVFNNLAGGEKGIKIEDYSGLAYGCQVFTQSDDYLGFSMTNPTIPDEFKKELKREIIMGRHSIVGTMSVIMPGVILAEGTSVGALSVVSKSTESWSIYKGNPAVKVLDRKRKPLELEKLYEEMLSKKS